VPAIPEELAYLLRTNVVAHVSLTQADGSLVTHVMWVDYDGEHIQTSSPTSSYKSRAVRERPNVAVSVVDPADPWRRLSISGRVTEIRNDEGLAFINTLSQRYVGAPYPRPAPREIFVISGPGSCLHGTALTCRSVRERARAERGRRSFGRRVGRPHNGNVV